MFYILLLTTFIVSNTVAEEDEGAVFSDEPTFVDILHNLYKYPKEVKNKNFIEANWGIGDPYIVPDVCDERFAPVYPLLFKYGFSRINPYMPVKDRFYNAGEYVAVENITSHFRPKDWEKDGNTVDIWRFIGGYGNGWGYIHNGRHFAFNHASYLGWARSDIELPSQIPDNQKELDRYDETYRFTNGFEASVNIEMIDNFYFKVAYNKSIIMPSFNFFEWVPGVFTELLMQRAIDAFGEKMLKKYPDIYPVANFLLKNSISFLLYELRKNNMFWPVSSHAPMNVYYFSVGLKFIF